MTDMSYAPGFLTEQSIKSEYNDTAEGVEKRKGSPRPYSIRFTWEERDQLTLDAGKKSWATHIRECVFKDQVSKRRKSQITNADIQAIARLSALLGKTRIPNNLNQLAKAANTGCLMTDDHTKAQLNEVCAHVAHIRQMLITALGVKDQTTQYDN